MGSLERLMDNRGKITPFVGTGATIAVLPDNPFARWDGLLEYGIRRCAELGQPKVWAEATVARLRSGDLITYLAVADEISRRLDVYREWRDWVKRTVGTIAVGDGSPMHKAICRLNRIVLTTNYDLLLEGASKEHKSLHWKQYDEVQEAINVDASHAIIHLHGVATSPDSVVLGSWQYQALKDNITAQFWQRVLLSRRLLLIGCGSGLDDPNIGSALEYVQFLLNPPSPEARSQSESNEPHEHYILVRGRELGAAWEKFSGSNIFPVTFGPEYTDLKQFLTDLAGGRQPEVSQDVHDYDAPLRTTQPQATSKASRAATPRPGLLDLAGPAEETLQGALDAAQRVLQALGQVERRSTLPPGADRWAAADQLLIHERTAASVMDPITRLQVESKALVEAVHEADVPIGLLCAQQDQALDALFTLVNELSGLCDDIGERVGNCIMQIKDYLKLTDHYRPAVTALNEIGSVVDDIRKIVKTLPRA